MQIPMTKTAWRRDRSGASAAASYCSATQKTQNFFLLIKILVKPEETHVQTDKDGYVKIDYDFLF
jgi:hypothetical protein